LQYKDEDWLRRDLIHLKAMGFNMIRYFQHAPQWYELDLCDEIGILVYQEPRGGWLYTKSPQMAARYERSLRELIQRDRNHPSVVIWGLLNETPTPGVGGNEELFPIAVRQLPLLRALDDSRVALLSSGRWDSRLDVGSVSNPGSQKWECLLGAEGPGAVGKMSSTDIPSTNGWLTAYVEGAGDAHIYPRVPHDARTVEFMRTVGQGTKPVFVSEYGIGSAVDLVRVARHYEQRGAEASAEAGIYRKRLDQFMSECWEAWKLAELFQRPEDYFRVCVTKMADLRLLGINIIRSNPNIIGYSVCGTVDQGKTGEGVTASTFRELKPGVVDAVSDGFAPLRWCLFTEPYNVYKGSSIKLEAVLANEDVLMAGDYPVRLEVFGPNGRRVLEKTTTVTIANPNAKPEPPLALPVFSQDVTVDWPEGKYRFVAKFDRGAAAAGGVVEFNVSDGALMPQVNAEVSLWGENAELQQWLEAHSIRSRPFKPEATAREVILVTRPPASSSCAEAFRELATSIARGSTAICLSPAVFARGDEKLGWLPLAKKGKLQTSYDWVYLKDEWAKRHPIFDGLPCGGLMDYRIYRNIIPDVVYYGQDAPLEAICGGAEVSFSYASGLMVCTHAFGNGRFILNTLRLEENLGKDPVAERLLRNMLRYASAERSSPPLPLPVDFEGQLKAIGYLR
jgi:hypothetical protein